MRHILPLALALILVPLSSIGLAQSPPDPLDGAVIQVEARDGKSGRYRLAAEADEQPDEPEPIPATKPATSRPALPSTLAINVPGDAMAPCAVFVNALGIHLG